MFGVYAVWAVFQPYNGGQKPNDSTTTAVNETDRQTNQWKIIIVHNHWSS